MIIEKNTTDKNRDKFIKKFTSITVSNQKNVSSKIIPRKYLKFIIQSPGLGRKLKSVGLIIKKKIRY